MTGDSFPTVIDDGVYKRVRGPILPMLGPAEGYVPYTLAELAAASDKSFARPETVKFYSVPVSYGAGPVADEKQGFFNPGPDIEVTERRSDGGRILDPENVTPAKKPEGERQERRG